MKTLFHRVNEARYRKGHTWADVGAVIGIDPFVLDTWAENDGRDAPGPEYVDRLVDYALTNRPGVSAEDLLDAMIRRIIVEGPPHCPGCRGVLPRVDFDEAGTWVECACGVKVTKGRLDGEAVEWLRAVLNTVQGTVTADLDHTLAKAREFAGLD